jgi:Raf kinase inhibitor-like YbhB/YbcL family protein
MPSQMKKSALATATVLAAHALLLTHCSGDDPPSQDGMAGSAMTGAGTSSAGASTTQAGTGQVGSGGAAGSQSGAGVAGSAVAASGTGTGGTLGGAAGSSNAGGGSGSGTAGSSTGGSGGSSGGGSSTSGTFAITSSAHAEGAVFADTFTCAGEGTSPPLAWTAGPAGTKSYAITFFDTTLVDMNSALGYHWVMWDIPAGTLALPAKLPSGASLTTPVVAKQMAPANPFDGWPKDTFFGPCPNANGNGNNTDTYAFTIYALSVEHLTGDLTSVKNVEAAIKASTPLATAKLTGKSSAKAPATP